MLTGATDGIGLATARLLVPRVRHLVLHGPQPDEDVRPLTSDLRRSMGQGSTLTYLRADYDELAQVRTLAAHASSTRSSMRGDLPAKAAANIVHVAGTDEHVNGRYYDERRPAQPNPTALNTGTQQELLRISSELTSP